MRALDSNVGAYTLAVTSDHHGALRLVPRALQSGSTGCVSENQQQSREHPNMHSNTLF